MLTSDDYTELRQLIAKGQIEAAIAADGEEMSRLSRLMHKVVQDEIAREGDVRRRVV